MIESKLLVGRYIKLPGREQDNAGAPVAGFQRLAPMMLHINESTRAHFFFGPKTSTTDLGHIAKLHRNYQWLAWRPGFVSEVGQNGVDVLTGPMSGCWITVYNRHGVQCVGHVGTAEPGSQATRDAKDAWNAFRGPAGAATGFNPLDAWDVPFPTMNDRTDAAPKVFGLVTVASRFYSIFAYQLLAAPTTIRIAAVQEVGNTLPNPIP